ncbi:MAG: hypothetical protein KIT84_01530 [Labilithrix sp.]|nr:hypothetical protein [Labilithrix sp.]MCW5809668.1 hypothetical protein [Labilithrix sp.]
MSHGGRRKPGEGRAGFNVLSARVALRDRGLADVLDLAVRFLSVHGRVFARLAACTLLPAAALSIVAGKVLGWRLAWVVAIPLAVAMEAPFTVLASRLVFEDGVRARDVLRASVRATPLVFTARLVALALTTAGVGCFVVPGVAVAALTLFAGEAMLLERAELLRAFGRAQSVAANAIGDVVLAVLIFACVPVAAVLLADVGGRTLIAEVFQFRPPRPVWTEGGGVLALLGLFLQVPFFATARFFLYLNVRTRTEGWDIQTRFAGLAARTDEPT